MRIEPFELALDAPLETAAGRIESREGFLVFVEHAGTEGVGEATPLPGWTESLDECRRAIERAATVAEELDWGIALARMDASAARHGLSLALADARASAANHPLYRSLGAPYTVRQVPVNATVGDGSVEETKTAVERAVATGFGCCKVKVGARDLETDLARLRATRDVAGDRVELRADANGAWDRETAARAMERLVDLDVSSVEQPLAADDLDGLADLRNGEVGIAVDETLIDHDLEAVLAADAADVIVCKPMVLGGPDRTAAVAARARESGVEPVVSTTIDGVVARTAAVHVAATIPEVGYCGLATAELLAEDLGRDPTPVEDGAVSVPQDKGLGLADRPGS